LIEKTDFVRNSRTLGYILQSGVPQESGYYIKIITSDYPFTSSSPALPLSRFIGACKIDIELVSEKLRRVCANPHRLESIVLTPNAIKCSQLLLAAKSIAK
jgi:hypothetical protein